MSFNQQNMRLIKLAGTAAIFGALTLSGCKSSKENSEGSDANDQELNTVYNGQKELYTKYTQQYETAVKEMNAQSKKENYTKESLTATVYSANEKNDLKYRNGTMVGYYTNQRTLTEADIAAANNNPSEFMYGYIVAIKQGGNVIQSDADVQNKDALEYVFSTDLGLNIVREDGIFKEKAREEIPLNRNQFLVDKSKAVQGKKSCANIKADFEKAMHDLQAKHEKTWSKMGSLKSEKKTKLTDKQKKLGQWEEHCFDVQSFLNYESAGKFEFNSAEVKKWHEGMATFYQTEMAKYTDAMKKATSEITASKYGQCAAVDTTFVRGKAEYERQLIPSAAKRAEVRELVSNHRIKNYDHKLVMKFWDMVEAGQKAYKAAKAECEKVANAKAPK